MKRIVLIMFAGLVAARLLAAYPVFAQWTSGPTAPPTMGMPISPEFIDFGSGSPEPDSGPNPSVWLEDTAGGDLIRLDRSAFGVPLFIVESDGDVGIQRMPNTAVSPDIGNLLVDVGDADTASEGDANATRLCIDGDCRDEWLAVVTGGGNGTGHYVTKWGASGQVTDSVIYNQAGNVGIGTETPGYQLDVSGQFNSTEFCIAGTCASEWSFAGTDNQNLYETINAVSGTDPVASSSTDVLNINAQGGILLTGADGVAGADSLSFDTDPNAIQRRISGGCGAGEALQAIAADGTFTCETLGELVDDWIISGSDQYSAVSGNVGIGTSTPAGKVHIIRPAGVSGLRISGPAGNTIFAHTNDWNYISGNGVIFRNTGNGEFARFVASSGRLGLGTTSPATRLHVNGSVRGNQSGALRINSGNGYVDVGPKNTAWAHFYTNRPAYYFDTEIRVDTGLIGSYNDHVQLRTQGSTRMILRNDNGRVGIGTNSPSTTLQVAGNTAVTGWLGAGCEVACDNNNRYALLYPGGYAQIKGSAHQIRLHDTDSNQYEWSITTYGQDQISLWRTSGSNQGSQLRVSSGDGDNRGAHAFAFFHESDRRLKENIRPHEGALDRVLALSPVTYEWRNDPKNRINLGFIAQDVEEVFPELVSEDSVTGLKSIDYGALTGPIVEAIRERQEQLDAMYTRARALEAAIATKRNAL